MLYLIEKYHIILSTKNLLNKRNELVTKCRHENKFYLGNFICCAYVMMIIIVEKAKLKLVFINKFGKTFH